ncbi:MAG: superoxide dismutase [Oligoflexia bacterium]|nr:superoxide dismutase [Oligoflexia bacterium]MBF0365083.1 superoxide dismutase [Oligoflexia bacterium]
MQHQLPALPYAMDALAPHVSRETLEYHYGKHHQTYVDNLNKLIPGSKFAEMSLEQIIRNSEGGIFNNAAQVWNHTFYWESLIPRASKKYDRPVGKLEQAINQSFGSFDAFKEKFSQAAVSTFGSGWAWLVRNNNSGVLEILSTSNAQTPLTDPTKTLIFTCDVWEHAYYIDYRNARAKYVDSFWNLVNYEHALKNFEK